MGSWKVIKELDNKFSWGFWGFLITSIALILAIYLGFFNEKNPSLTYDILTNNEIIDVKENLSKLNIYYNGNDIEQNKQNLRFITIKITNDGNKHILKTFIENPIGFSIDNGKIVDKPEIIKTNNSYLKDNLKLWQINSHAIQFSNVSFEANSYCIIKILVLSQNRIVPNVIPTGKIIGISKINKIDSYKNNNDPSFVENLTHGSLLIHTVRFFIYLLIIAIFIVLIVFPVVKILNHKSRKKKQILIEEFKKSTTKIITVKDTIIFNLFIQNEINHLLFLNNVLRSNNAVISLFINKLPYIDLEDASYSDRETIFSYYATQTYRSIFELLKKEIVTVKSGKVTIDKEFKAKLLVFIEYIIKQSKSTAPNCGDCRKSITK
jgi:hypothetical protein